MHLSLAAFKSLVRDQFFVLLREQNSAVEVLAAMVPEMEARQKLLKQVAAIARAGDALSANETDRLAHLSKVLAVPSEKPPLSLASGRTPAVKANADGSKTPSHAGA
jgi:hypothetical protein